MPETTPRIVVVDDQPAVGTALRAALSERAAVVPVHPRDVEDRHFKGTHLVLVDLRLEEWPERDDYPMACQPLTGLGLAAVLKDHLIDRLRHPSPVAFALHSGHTEDLSRGLPSEVRPHVLAATNNLAWVFTKGSRGVEAQLLSLARAVASLPPDWDSNDYSAVRSQVGALLALDESEWSGRAWNDVESCRPPIHTLTLQSHGLALIRWLLHRVLPYPCFLLDDWRLALRFRVDAAQVREHLADPDSALARALASFQYRGICSDFLGARWWGAGLETLIWNITKGRPFDAELLRQRIRELGRFEFTAQAVKDAVQCLGVDLQPQQAVTTLAEAVRIQPDDWPAYADQAWAPLVLAREEPRLRALVISDDRGKLEA
jgi:hypothetical protein